MCKGLGEAKESCSLTELHDAVSSLESCSYIVAARVSENDTTTLVLGVPVEKLELGASKVALWCLAPSGYLCTSVTLRAVADETAHQTGQAEAPACSCQRVSWDGVQVFAVEEFSFEAAESFSAIETHLRPRYGTSWVIESRMADLLKDEFKSTSGAPKEATADADPLASPNSVFSSRADPNPKHSDSSGHTSRKSLLPNGIRRYFAHDRRSESGQSSPARPLRSRVLSSTFSSDDPPRETRVDSSAFKGKTSSHTDTGDKNAHTQRWSSPRNNDVRANAYAHSTSPRSILRSTSSGPNMAAARLLHSMFECIVNSMQSATTVCVVCGDRLSKESLKPSTCAAEVCTRVFAANGYGIHLSSFVRREPEVFDLLLSLACSADISSHMKHSFPTRVSSTLNGETHSFLRPDGSGNADLLREVLHLVPTLDEMAEAASGGESVLKELLDRRHTLIYPLLRWLVGSVPVHIRPLSPSERLAEFSSGVQFVVRHSLVEHATSGFLDLKRKAEQDGRDPVSFHLFHGSPVGNWYSILRRGFQIEGAPGFGASGRKIWLANHLTTTIGYCHKDGKTGGWQHSKLGKSIMCLGIVETVHDAALGVVPATHTLATEHLGHMETRYLVIYPERIPRVTLKMSDVVIPDTLS